MKKVLVLIIIGLLCLSMFSMFTSQAKADADLYSLPSGAKAWSGAIDTETILVSMTQQVITASPGEIITLTPTYQVWSSGGPGIIKQAFFIVSWTPSWPPPSGYYIPLYDGQPGYYPGVTETRSFSITVPSTAGIYYVWFGLGAHYSMQDAVNQYINPLTLPAHAKIIVGVVPPPTFPWKDDFNYNTLDEMKAAGWTLSNEFMISVGGGAVTLDNDGSVGSEATYSSFPSGIYDWRAETSSMWIGRSYGSIHLSVETERHDYRWGGDGYYPEFVLYRDGVKVLEFGGYTPQLNTWVKFAIEKSGTTIYLYCNDELKNTYTEPDATPSALISTTLWSGWIATVKYDYISVMSPVSGVIPEVPLGTIMVSASMITALAAYVTMPKLRKRQRCIER